MEMKKIFSFDAETNGLWGKAFAIGAVLVNGNEVTKFVARCPISETINHWVAENVLPQMESIPMTHNSYVGMLRDFMRFYMENKNGAIVLVHMGLPVEAKLSLDAHSMGIIGDWDAPYPLTDISAIPEIGVSPDTYNRIHGVKIPTENGGTHNPLYDSWSALLAYQHWMERR